VNTRSIGRSLLHFSRKGSRILKPLVSPFLRTRAGAAFRAATRFLDGSPYGSSKAHAEPGGQDLAIYSDPRFAKALESWGEDNAWTEIQLLLATCRGRVLDIACGTGKVIEILSRFPGIELYGCDISHFLIRRALARGISATRLLVCDASQTPYLNGHFDYAYSIGSLEHFTRDGIAKVIWEASRITRMSSFHHVPVSRSGEDEGWITVDQSYYNNSENWWLERFSETYRSIRLLPSAWHDDRSVGRWFVCSKAS
jgi:ubiquinone/menaquinone biosynthesis C-methylase UbiE